MSLVGRQIGRYRILEELGSGGMSVVYKGLDTALDREVAVKVLHPHLAGKAESRKRMAREAKAVAKLHHPNILEIFDFSAGEAPEAYLVTEYIRGRTLRDYLATESFDPPELAAMVIHELASALAHAHACGVIHRDIKPENVMVREDGCLKLMDFGIAKILDREERMTMTGALVGSPAHMAPEIIEGNEAGPSADIFSLGTMLYLFATGRLPFTAANTTATLKRILDGSYDDPRQLSPRVSDDLTEIISKCLARRPDERYRDAGALRDALAAYLAPLGLRRVNEELPRFFGAPKAYRDALRRRLVDALLQQGQQFQREGRAAKALSAINHVLALDETNATALAILAQMNRKRRREQRIAQYRRAGVGMIAVALVAAGAFEGGRALRVWMAHRAVATTRMPTAAPSTGGQAAAPPAMVRAPAGQTALVPLPPLTLPNPAPTATISAPVPATKHAPKPHLAEVVLQVRPFADYVLDDGQHSTEPNSRHTLHTTVGTHTVTLLCDACDTVHETIDVKPGQNLFALGAQIKPSKLRFEFQPPDAVVRIDDEERAVSATRDHPFVVRSPRGTPTLKHIVHYEVTRPGYKAESNTATIPAGQDALISGSLNPE